MKSRQCNETTVLVAGGGPAGLFVAERCAAAGHRVVVLEAMPSLARKFLVAGSSGLNLTNGESLETMGARYTGETLSKARWAGILAEFSPGHLRAWARGLGVETFESKGGRVFPVGMKGGGLFRHWREQLTRLGVEVRCGTRLVDWQPSTLGSGAAGLSVMTASTEQPSVRESVATRALVLALGGASWGQTGSDGAWTSLFSGKGIALQPWAPANCGWEVAWTAEALAVGEGRPLKNARLTVAGTSLMGEIMVTRYGIEGTPVYALGPLLRKQRQPVLEIDLKPEHSVEQLVHKLGPIRRRYLPEAIVRWRLSGGAAAVLVQAAAVSCAGGVETAEALARLAKALPLSLVAPRPLSEAISSAGGVSWQELTEGLMLRQHAGVFVAGEMLDWEAPTGGYLLQGCFSTAARAARGVCDYLAAVSSMR